MMKTKWFKVVSLSICCTLGIQSIVFADEFVNIGTLNNNMTKTGITIENIEMDGAIKTVDEKTGLYVFTFEDGNIAPIQEEANVIELSEYGMDIDKSSEEYNLSDDEIMTLASLPDLYTSTLMPDGTLVGGSGTSTKFNYKLGNYGSVNAKNVSVGIKVDGTLIGTVSAETIEAQTQYSAYFNLNNVSVGTHTVEVIVDPNNAITESNESNNSTSGTYTWVSDTSGLPDLTVEITAPTGNTIKGPVNENDTVELAFKITNVGSVATPDRNFLITIYSDDTAIQSFFVNPINAKTSRTGRINMAFTVYKPTIVKAFVDSANEINESDETNNTSSKTYTPVYCIHDAQDVTTPFDDSSSLRINVMSNAIDSNSGLGIDFYSSYIGAWNGITENCKITEAVSSSKISSADDILIYGDSIFNGTTGTINFGDMDFDTLAFTTDYMYNGKVYKIIVLNFNDGQYSTTMKDRTVAENRRTLIHEMGHALGLGHPFKANTSSSCGYPSIMLQSGSTESQKADDIQLHDMYNIYMKYDSSAPNSVSSSINHDKLSDVQICVEMTENVSDLSQLENTADYIIRAKVMPDSENIVNNISGYTKTKLEIIDSLKGTLESGDEIYIREPYYTNEINGNEITIHRDNYNSSEIGKEYIFFLSKYPNTDIYGLRFATKGRYIVPGAEILRKPTISDSSECNMTVEYEQLYKQVYQKYIK